MSEGLGICSEIRSVNVYATAGMRLKEQTNEDESLTLWKRLRNEIDKYINERRQSQDSMWLQTKYYGRTITGFEEGIYAYLAMGQTYEIDVGLTEMGGASAQIVFPTNLDQNPKNNILEVMIAGVNRNYYSNSFLGLGQDQAALLNGITPNCRNGVKGLNDTWSVDTCGIDVRVTELEGKINDPFNYHGETLGRTVSIPESKNVKKWKFSGQT